MGRRYRFKNRLSKTKDSNLSRSELIKKYGLSTFREDPQEQAALNASKPSPDFSKDPKYASTGGPNGNKFIGDNNTTGGTDRGRIRIYELDSDNTRDPFKISIVNNTGVYDTSIGYSGSSILSQSVSSVNPTINQSGGSFTFTPTYITIQDPLQWNYASGDYYLDFNSLTGTISPSTSLAGTYNVTHTIGCDSSTMSITIRSVNDIDHTSVSYTHLTLPTKA